MSTEGGSDSQTDITDGTHTGSGAGVTLFNCSCHSFDQVEKALIAAIKCGISKARGLATEIDKKGSVLVYEGDPVECENVAMILEAAGLKVKISS
jgi:hypothetical protein